MPGGRYKHVTTFDDSSHPTAGSSLLVQVVRKLEGKPAPRGPSGLVHVHVHVHVHIIGIISLGSARRHVASPSRRRCVEVPR
jgi:hypothetical protein